MAEGLDFGTGPNDLDFGTHSPDWSKECSPNPPYPKATQTTACFSITCGTNPPSWLCSGCWNAGFQILVFFLLGGNLPPSSASLSGRFLLIKTLGLAALVLALTLGALFIALLFLSLMLECCIFVVISTGMCCAQTDMAALLDLKDQCSASVWLGVSKERFLQCRTISLELLNQIINYSGSVVRVWR